MTRTLRLALADARNDLRVWRGIALDPEQSELHTLAAEQMRLSTLRAEWILECLRDRA